MGGRIIITTKLNPKTNDVTITVEDEKLKVELQLNLQDMLLKLRNFNPLQIDVINRLSGVMGLNMKITKKS